MENAVSEEFDEDFNLFGEKDLSDIPDDPWFVAAGTYFAVVTKSERKTTRQGDQALVISYTIDEPDSDYHGQTKTDYFQLFPGVAYADLDPDQKKVRIRMKQRFREAFDKTEEEMPRTKPGDLVGEKVYLTVVENAGKGEHEGKTFSNISKIVSKRLYEEQNPESDNSMKAAGFAGM